MNNTDIGTCDPVINYNNNKKYRDQLATDRDIYAYIGIKQDAHDFGKIGDCFVKKSLRKMSGNLKYLIKYDG